MKKKYREIRYSIAIIVVAIIVTLITFKWINISDDRRWTDLTQTFLYPLCYTIIGSAILSCAALAISNKVLDRYNDRIGYGLAKRTIYFQGDEDQIQRIKKDLRISNLIKAQNYNNLHISIADADIVILCIKKKYKRAEKDNPEFPEVSNKPKIRTSEYTEWLESAYRQIDTITNGSLVDSQALIIFTDGWLDHKAKSLFDQRSFTTLVNTPGRIVSDIHSLLTTLPPRNGE